mmetsp:Transcript_8340/g.23438  ORF Transcript_8340/g.23438 Transcript_8340/m.23438 type:complete len:97 (-) Transcript_8340:657-947(-)
MLVLCAAGAVLVQRAAPRRPPRGALRPGRQSASPYEGRRGELRAAAQAIGASSKQAGFLVGMFAGRFGEFVWLFHCEECTLFVLAATFCHNLEPKP